MAPRQIPIERTAKTAVIGGCSMTASRLWVAVEFSKRDGGSVMRDCLLDSGAPMSVVPFSFQQTYDLDWQIVSDPSLPRAHWFDVECDIGQIDVWLPDNTGSMAGPFTLVAKFPRATPRALRGPHMHVPILLGLNFITDVHGEVHFQCHLPFDAGSIFIP